MSVSELEECLFLRNRLRSIYTEKLAVNNRWEMGMENLRLYELRDKASDLLLDSKLVTDAPVRRL